MAADADADARTDRRPIQDGRDRALGDGDDSDGKPDDEARAALARAIARRPVVSPWLGIVLALGFAAIVTPVITLERWPLGFGAGTVTAGQPAPFTVRAPMLAGYDELRVRGGVVIARGDRATPDEAAMADAIAGAMPRGLALYGALFALLGVLAAIFSHHTRRSIRGQLLRVQLVSLAGIAALAMIVKLALLSTAMSALAVPIAVFAIVPTMALDRVVGLATGVLAALVVSVLGPFDVGLAILLLAQAVTAGLVIGERPRRRWLAALTAGLAATVCTSASFLLVSYLVNGDAPALRDPLHAGWIAAAIGPAIAAVLAVPILPIYQRLVGEITESQLIALEDLGHPLLRQISERAPGTWQHSLMIANMAELAANAIGANGRMARVGAYFHDLGKSLSPKYFIENLEPGETSPHDQLPPEVSCDAILAHVTDGIATARKARLHARIVDFMHMHHGDSVLEYFWARCREQGNPHGFAVERFRYPGDPPRSRETAILTICDAVEAASRTLKKPDAASIDALVERIVYGKLHLGQLDDSGLAMADLRRITESLRETIRHANGRIAYPGQRAASATDDALPYSTTVTRIDELAATPDLRAAELRPTTPHPPEAVAARAKAAEQAVQARDAAEAAGESLTPHNAPTRPIPTISEIPHNTPTRPIPAAELRASAARGERAELITAVASPAAGLRAQGSKPPASAATAAGIEEAVRGSIDRSALSPSETPTVAMPPSATPTIPSATPTLAMTASATPTVAMPPSATPTVPMAPSAATLAMLAGATPALATPASPTSAAPPSPASAPASPGGRPPRAPTDPQQIAAALSAIVSRVTAAPLGLPRPPDDRRPPLGTAAWPRTAEITAPPVARDDVQDSRPTTPRGVPASERPTTEWVARRPPHPTAEVDPDDIEAAIEVAPPARRPTPRGGVRRPKKQE